MTTTVYKPEDVTFTGDATGFGEPFILSTRPDVMKDMHIVSPPGPADFSATGSFRISRSEHRKLVALAQGRRPRASKGWRRHVRRMKAADKREGL